jgi:non-haem dioxygenase in morphine synthesis N-terminal
MYTAAERFFNLPIEVKQRVNIANSGPTLRGYIPTYAENADPENSRDFKECFDLGAHQPDVSPFFGQNQMPSEPADFKETCEAYHSTMMALARKLISAISLSLDLPADYFEAMQRKPITIQRLLYYPPQKGEVSQEEIGNRLRFPDDPVPGQCRRSAGPQPRQRVGERAARREHIHHQQWRSGPDPDQWPLPLDRPQGGKHHRSRAVLDTILHRSRLRRSC